MSIDKFINLMSGKLHDFDKILGPQCTDVVKYWASYNGWPIPNGGGHDALGYKNFKNGYRFIINTIRGVPQAGDIMVWNLGNYGHVDIFVSGNWLNCITFGQCWPRPTLLNAKGKVVQFGSPAGVVSHPLYRGVVGWLRKT